MVKKNLEELLNVHYDKKECALELLKYYKGKLEDNPSLKYIYTTWISDLETKIKERDITIQYLQSELFDD